MLAKEEGEAHRTPQSRVSGSPLIRGAGVNSPGKSPYRCAMAIRVARCGFCRAPRIVPCPPSLSICGLLWAGRPQTAWYGNVGISLPGYLLFGRCVASVVSIVHVYYWAHGTTMPMRMTVVPGYRASWFGDLARNRWKLRSIFSLRLDGELKGVC